MNFIATTINHRKYLISLTLRDSTTCLAGMYQRNEIPPENRGNGRLYEITPAHAIISCEFSAGRIDSEQVAERLVWP